MTTLLLVPEISFTPINHRPETHCRAKGRDFAPREAAAGGLFLAAPAPAGMLRDLDLALDVGAHGLMK